MTALEVNFDGLVGPTHNYAGLSHGNVASIRHGGEVANPRAAALQGVAKMRRLIELGLTQAILPPHDRPDTRVLRSLGVKGDSLPPELPDWVVASAMSASPMWAANAATVSPSADTQDGRVHLTPANLATTMHRSFEARQTTANLRAILGDPSHFCVHDPLPTHPRLADEGAANHGRLTTDHARRGTQIFVYSRDGQNSADGDFPRRQTLAAGRLISASHGLAPDRLIFIRQSDDAIDAGAFHNDVVSVVNESVVFHHEDAFVSDIRAEAALAEAVVVTVPRSAVSLQDAVSSYLFNSQLVTLPDATMALIAPVDVAHNPRTAAYLDAAVADVDNPISAVHTLDLRQSMSNGGGPACLRLRVVLTPEELAAVAPGVVMSDASLDDLEAWIRRHYRDRLHPSDLRDPALVAESRTALDELTQMLDLGPLYDFQRETHAH